MFCDPFIIVLCFELPSILFDTPTPIKLLSSLVDVVLIVFLQPLSIDEFLIELDKSYRIEEKGEHFYKPSQKHHFSMYLDGKFYSLYLRKSAYTYKDVLSKLDAEILYKTILKPILGIDNLDNNDRIRYRNNKLDMLSIKTLVDNGQFEIGFGMLPITIDEMKKIADAQLIMPPKTSYIEPKLRSGLTMYEF